MADGEMRTDSLAHLALPNPPTTTEGAWRSAALALSGTLPSGPWGGAWRLNGAPQLRVRHGDETRSIDVPAEDDAMGHGFAVDPTGGEAFVDVEGQSVEFSLAAAPSVDDAARHATAAGQGAATLTAPMPGRVISVRAAEGASVSEHEPLIVIEAMKMEHAVLAPMSGTLTRLLAVEGMQVQRGDTLAEVTTDEAQP
jgi:biotin carboxyl carrier protein